MTRPEDQGGTMSEEILEGDALRAWMDEPPVARCSRCRRFTFEKDATGTECRMPQPDGNPCGGAFRLCTSRDVEEYAR